MPSTPRPVELKAGFYVHHKSTPEIPKVYHAFGLATVGEPGDGDILGPYTQAHFSEIPNVRFKIFFRTADRAYPHLLEPVPSTVLAKERATIRSLVSQVCVLYLPCQGERQTVWALPDRGSGGFFTPVEVGGRMVPRFKHRPAYMIPQATS